MHPAINFYLALACAAVMSACTGAPISAGAEAGAIQAEQADETEPSRTDGMLRKPKLRQLQGPEPRSPLQLDACDDPVYAGHDWSAATFGPVTLRFLEGTAAALDLRSIGQARLSAYHDIQQFLGQTADPQVTVVLSPNRAAAVHHGHGVGGASVEKAQVEVIYTGAADSYERLRPGHELAHVLAGRAAGGGKRLPLLDEGLAELLDASGRDHHQAYVDQLLAGAVPNGFVAQFDDRDVWGKNYGRAGSFVKFLVDRYGRERFLQLWAAATVTQNGWVMTTSAGDKVRNGVELETAIDRWVREIYGEPWDVLRREWMAALAPYFEAGPSTVSAEDQRQIAGVIGALDEALTAGDAAAYRSALEGFYCDQWPDAVKERISRGAVEGRGEVETRLLAVRPLGIRNFREVFVQALRVERRGAEGLNEVPVQLWLEHFPTGWRVSWATQW